MQPLGLDQSSNAQSSSNALVDWHNKDCNCFITVLGLKSEGAGGYRRPDRLVHAVEGLMPPAFFRDQGSEADGGTTRLDRGVATIRDAHPTIMIDRTVVEVKHVGVCPR